MGTDDLQAWIEAVDRLESRQLPTREEMRAVARESGLDESVLERAAERAEALHAQGRRFLDEGLPDEAVPVLLQARSLEPWSLDVLASLGRAHLTVFQRSGDRMAGEAAEKVARLLIESDVQSGYELLKALKRQADGPSRRPGLVAVMGAVLAVAAGGLAWFANRIEVPPAVDPDVHPVVEAPALETVRVGDMDVALTASALPGGATAEITGASLTKLTDGGGWILNLTGVVRNGGDRVIEEAIADVKALDADGRIVATADLTLVDSNHPAVYGGDRSGGEVYLRGAASGGVPTTLVVDVSRVKSEPGQRGAGEPVALTWASPPPPDVSLALGLRENGSCRPSLGRSFCGGIFTITNTGTVPIELVKVRVTLPDGRSHETYALAARGRALRPGEREPWRVAHMVDGPPVEGPWTYAIVDVRTP